MHRHLRDHRRRALSVVAAVMLGTAAAVLVALPRSAKANPSAAAPASASQPQAATSSPAPCPTSPLASLCAVRGGPAPTPTSQPPASPSHQASPTGHPAPTASPSANAAAAGTVPGAGTPPSPDAAARAAAAASNLVIAGEAAARFRNAPYLDGLLEILAHPVSAQLPDLRHFRPAPEPAHAATATTGAHTAVPTSVRLGAAMVISLLATVAAGLLAWKRRGPRTLLRRLWRGAVTVAAAIPQPLVPRLRRRVSGVGATLVALALMGGTLAITGVAVHAWRGSPAAPRPLATRPHHPAATPAQPAIAPIAAPAWTRLLTIERGLTAQQDELAGQEREIARIAALIAGTPSDGNLPAAPGAYADLTNRLAALVAAHQATQGAYQLSLEAEYDLFYSVAESPKTRDQLVTSAAQAQAQAPEAKDAVTYDLSLVETQVSQEEAIAAAQAKLAQFGSLTAPQVDAIQHRRPFLAPEVASVSQPFGPTDFSLEPPLTYRGVFYPHFHTGVDLAAPLGTPVHASADGVVILAASSVDSKGHLVGYGNYVVIAHQDGFVTLYGHLDTVAVHAGDTVRQGQIIGREGSTGWSTGPHLHFEIRHGGSLLDPAPYLAGQLPA